MENSKLMSKKNKMIMLKILMQKVQKSLSLGKILTDIDEFIHQDDHQYDHHDHDHQEACFDDLKSVPKDVKEGHFAVVAVNEGIAKRFVVPLRYLTHPMFLTLLEKAAEEYGFDHGGALTIPCRPNEIERILAERWDGKRTSSYSKKANNGCKRNSNFMVQSY